MFLILPSQIWQQSLKPNWFWVRRKRVPVLPLEAIPGVPLPMKGRVQIIFFSCAWLHLVPSVDWEIAQSSPYSVAAVFKKLQWAAAEYWMVDLLWISHNADVYCWWGAVSIPSTHLAVVVSTPTNYNIVNWGRMCMERKQKSKSFTQESIRGLCLKIRLC